MKARKFAEETSKPLAEKKPIIHTHVIIYSGDFVGELGMSNDKSKRTTIIAQKSVWLRW